MKRGRRSPRATFPCPHCGAEVPSGKRACRECGSDADTGWQSAEEIDYQSLDLPSGYARDPDHPGVGRKRARPRWLLLTTLVLTAAMLAWAVLR